LKATTARRPSLRAALLAVLALAVAACGGEASDSDDVEALQDAGEVTSARDATGPATAEQDVAQPDSTEEVSAASCYEGETATFVSSYGPGSNYDTIARMLAPFLEEELDATVVVEDQEGAGGLLAANSLITAEPDGLTFGFFSGQGIAGSVLGGAERVQFELLDPSYVARVAAEPRLLVVGAQTEYQTLEDVQDAQGLTFASAGPGGSDHIDATVLFPVLGIDGEIITGFPGGPGTELAVTAGDTDAMSGTVSSRLPALDSGDHRAVLLIGEEPVEELPDVPALLELDLDEGMMALAEAHVTLQEMGRMVWAPPEVPEDCLAELRDAFEVAVANPDFVAQMEGSDQVINFLNGEDARAVAESVLQAPAEYVALLEQAYRSQ